MTPRTFRLLRRALAISQAEMGRLLCTSQEMVSSIERGRRRPQTHTLQLLRHLVHDPRIRRWLEEAGYPHPWPGEDEPDLVAQVFGPHSGRCAGCGVRLPETYDGRLCLDCRLEIAERRN